MLRPTSERMKMIEPEDKLSIKEQCDILSVSRSSFYYKPTLESEENLLIMRHLDGQYLDTPFYGVKKLLASLILLGYKINVKRLRRLMKLVGWQTIYPTPKTTKSDPTKYKYPYLLRVC